MRGVSEMRIEEKIVKNKLLLPDVAEIQVSRGKPILEKSG